MKKFGVILILLILLAFLPFTLAQDIHDEEEDPNTPDPIDTSNNAEKAYQCLQNQIDNKDSSSLSLQEAIFSTLALGSNQKSTDRIEQDKGENCWPSSSCTIKETAQVLLAYDRVNKNTNEIENWLNSKNASATDLTWFLQIDITNHIPATCTLKYAETQKTINIEEDLTISGSPGQCFTISSSGYWLKVRNNCLSETFQVSCEEDFVTSLLYQKSDASTIFVSPITHSAASSGTTEEKINSKCFKTGSSCDYEGSLWAAMSLQKAGHDVSEFLPYLLALSEDNRRLFPSAFLYILTQGDDQYSEIVQSQKQEKFWQAPSTRYNKFYDTALAMLSLQGSAAQELDNSLNYLSGIQTPNGCWNNDNIRDTAFILYSGWPKNVKKSSGGTSGTSVRCETIGSCAGRFECIDVGGSILENYECTGFGEICCDVNVADLTCDERGGIVCSQSQQCSGTVVNSPDGSCCLGSCQETPQANDCEFLAGGTCSFSCDSDTEKETSDSCDDPGLVCCIESFSSDSDSSSGIWVWVVVLLFLIALVVLGIIFRKKLQLLWFKFRNKKKGPKQPPRGGPPRRIPSGQMARRPMIRRPTGQPLPRRPPVRRASPSKSDKELEDTLKKLREMSK